MYCIDKYNQINYCLKTFCYICSKGCEVFSQSDVSGNAAKIVMKRLKIYYPSLSIKLSLRQWIMLILIALVIFLEISKSYSIGYKDELGALAFVAIVATFLYFLYFIISNFFAYESTPGFFRGFLVITDEKIICDDRVFTFDEIENVAILNNWFRGNHTYNIQPLEPKKSNGVKNYIKITLKSGEVKKYFFLQTQTENLMMFASELRNYYRFGKLNEQNYKNIIDSKHYR